MSFRNSVSIITTISKREHHMLCVQAVNIPLPCTAVINWTFIAQYLTKCKCRFNAYLKKKKKKPLDCNLLWESAFAGLFSLWVLPMGRLATGVVSTETHLKLDWLMCSKSSHPTIPPVTQLQHNQQSLHCARLVEKKSVCCHITAHHEITLTWFSADVQLEPCSQNACMYDDGNKRQVCFEI